MKQNSCRSTLISFFLMLGVFLLFAGQVGAEQRLLYPQEQALKTISNKLTPIVKDYRIYKTLLEKGQYLRDPVPELTEMEAKVIKLEEEFNAQDLPADNQKIKNIKSWFPVLKENVPKLLEYYQEGWKKHQLEMSKSDLSNFPDYQQDVERLKEMYKLYKSPEYTFQNTEKAKKAVQTFQDDYAFFKHVPVKYAAPLEANKAQQLVTQIRTNAQYLDAFKEYMETYLSKLPGMISKELGQASSMAQKAKQENKPLFFKGGVRQHMDIATNYLSLLTAAKGENAPEVTRMNSEFMTCREKVDSAEKAMAEELLASVTMPADSYNGSDKKKLKGMITSEWKKLYPSDKILAVVFPNSSWQRTTSWKWNEAGWYKVDTSVLSTRVIIEKDQQIATIYPAFINMNHLKNDQLSVGVHTKGAGYVVQNMLLKNVK